MLCRDCRFSLVCVAGRLGYGQREPGSVTLCPTCRRLIVTLASDIEEEENTIFAFQCEKRTVTPEIKLRWAKQKEAAAKAEHQRVMSFLIPDPGPGLRVSQNRLLISECVLCSHFMSRLPGVQFRDLDEEAQLRDESAEHAFKLR